MSVSQAKSGVLAMLCLLLALASWTLPSRHQSSTSPTPPRRNADHLSDNSSPLIDDEPSGADIYKDLLRSVAWIITPDRTKGTGWLLDRSRRLLVTSYHVIGENDSVEAIFPYFEKGKLIAERGYYRDHADILKRDGHQVTGRVLYKEKRCDLALIELASLPESAEPLSLAAESPTAGARVHSIGNRGDLDALWIYTSGSVRQVVHTEEGYYWQGRLLSKGAGVIVAQSPINEGDSGGPFVNDAGELVGVAAAVRWQALISCVCIDVREVRGFLERSGNPLLARRVSVRTPARRASEGARLSAKEIYKQALRSVALVKTSASNARSTAWLLDRRRKLLVTNHHVVGALETVDLIFPAYEDGKLIAEANFYKGKGHAVRGHVLATDARRNLALIEAESLPDGMLDMKLATDSPEPGERLHAVGNPNSIEALWVYTTGAVRQSARVNLGQTTDAPDPRVVVAQLPINDGDGGGPVLNERGQLVAVASGREGAQQLISYCIDITEVRAFVTETRPKWDPRSAMAYYQRGSYYLKSRRFDRALADFDEAIRLDDKLAVSYCDRAVVHVIRGEQDRAIADCDLALQLDPKLAAAHCHRAAAWSGKGMQDRAITDCDAALRIDSKCALAYSVRGNAYRLKGDADRAVRDCDEAIYLDRQLPTAYFHRGLARLDRGEHEKAVADLIDALKRQRDLMPAVLSAVRDRSAKLGKGGHGDQVRRYELYTTALTALRPLLEDRPELHRIITDGLVAGAAETDARRRAELLDRVLEALANARGSDD
jgi:S1-C subfamily serine protease